MKKATTILAALAMGAVTAAAGTAPAPMSSGKGPAPSAPVMDPCAGPISYSNVELLYAYTDIDNYSDNGNGARLNIEYSPFQNLYFRFAGSYDTFDTNGDNHVAAAAGNYGSDSIDYWTVSAGIGGYVPLTENIHLAGDAGIIYEKWDGGGGGNDDDTGWYVRPHLRAKWGCLEAQLGAQYTDVGDNSSDEWSGFAKLYYQVSPGWDLTAGVRYSDNITEWSGGVRYRF